MVFVVFWLWLSALDGWEDIQHRSRSFGIGAGALFLQMELSERSEFSICGNEISRQTQPLKLPNWRCGPPAHPNLTIETEKHKKILDYFRHLVLSYTVHYCGAVGLFVLPGNRWEKLVNNSA